MSLGIILRIGLHHIFRRRIDGGLVEVCRIADFAVVLPRFFAQDAEGRLHQPVGHAVHVGPFGDDVTLAFLAGAIVSVLRMIRLQFANPLGDGEATRDQGDDLMINPVDFAAGMPERTRVVIVTSLVCVDFRIRTEKGGLDVPCR